MKNITKTIILPIACLIVTIVVSKVTNDFGRVDDPKTFTVDGIKYGCIIPSENENVTDGCTIKIMSIDSELWAGDNNVIIRVPDYIPIQIEFGEQSYDPYTIPITEIEEKFIDMDNTDIIPPDALHPINVFLGDNITAINDKAFTDCSDLSSIDLGDNLTTIGDNAFSGCNNLSSIDLGDNLTTIGDNVFSGCEKGLKVIIKNPNVSTKDTSNKITLGTKSTIVYTYKRNNLQNISNISDTTTVRFAEDTGELIPSYEESIMLKTSSSQATINPASLFTTYAYLTDLNDGDGKYPISMNVPEYTDKYHKFAEYYALNGDKEVKVTGSNGKLANTYENIKACADSNGIVTLYSKWESRKWDVSYENVYGAILTGNDCNGVKIKNISSDSSSYQYVSGGNLIKTYDFDNDTLSDKFSLPVLKRQGLTFKGWYKGKTGNAEKIDESLYGVTEPYKNPITESFEDYADLDSITLYAKWDLNTVPVTYKVILSKSA